MNKQGKIATIAGIGLATTVGGCHRYDNGPRRDHFN